MMVLPELERLDNIINGKGKFNNTNELLNFDQFRNKSWRI